LPFSRMVVLSVSML
jgi:hypothetical protein